jgi:hypothetical protein
MFRKLALFVITLCLSTLTLLAANTNLVGTWEAQGSHEGKMQTWLMTFDVRSDTFVGTWRSVENENVREIKEGKIVGNEFSFKVLKKDGTTAMICKGTVAGDKMKLSIDNLSEGDHRQATAVRKAGS